MTVEMISFVWLARAIERPSDHLIQPDRVGRKMSDPDRLSVRFLHGFSMEVEVLLARESIRTQEMNSLRYKDTDHYKLSIEG